MARSTFPSQNVQNTPASDHFWKLRCRKSARRCGAKHMSKSKCTKHTMFGPLLEVAMSKKCTALWREANVQVKSVKKIRVRTTFWHSDVEKLWRKAHFQVKSAKKYGFGPLFDVQMSKKCTRLWREAHFQVNRVKNWQARTTFWRSDVETARAVVVWSTFGSQKCQNLGVLNLV